jgi:regulator of RNase E activity RraA
MLMKEITDGYMKIRVPAVCDVLDKEFGCWNQILNKDIRPLQLHHKVAGPAYTMFGVKSRETDKKKRLIVHAIDEMVSGSVVVMSTGGDESTGHWGELLSNAAIYRGVNGAVLDGGIRDTGAIIELGFPIFHRYFAPGDSTGRFNIIEYQTPIIVGGVKVNPGDFIFGDCDGVIVIPKDIVEPVLKAATEVYVTEDEIRDRIRKGEKVASLFFEYGQL